jgi:hypothetical protein
MIDRVAVYHIRGLLNPGIVAPSVMLGLLVGCSHVSKVDQHAGFEFVDPAAMTAVDESEAAQQVAVEASEPVVLVSEENASDTHLTSSLESSEELSESSQRLADSLERQAEIQKEIAAIESAISALESSAKEVASEQALAKTKPEDTASPNLSSVVLKPSDEIKKKELLAPVKAQADNNEQLIAQVNRLQKEQPSAAGIPPEVYGKMADSIAALTVAERELFKTLQTNAGKQVRTESDFDWQLVQKWNGDAPDGCRLTSPTVQLESNDYATQIWFDVVDNRLKLNTTTNLDIALSGVGIQANGQALEKFSDLEYRENAIWSGDLSETLKNSEKLMVVVGGNELGRQRQQASIELGGLKAVYADYLDCEETRSLAKR